MSSPGRFGVGRGKLARPHLLSSRALEFHRASRGVLAMFSMVTRAGVSHLPVPGSSRADFN
ncbi:hypothetical protein AQI70_07470 [Streptomyces curacoi]|uniref:Uncharacterized protein n=1 Tax=Streptomyces curacoi TaxID=146536 RepID=A0A124H646_9ACTN|nr:hypothetical protein AQI70_07470 [Streptomyces curacoi]